MTGKIGIAIFSQSVAIAKGAAEVVCDLVGDQIPCVHYGRPPTGRLEDVIAGMQEALSTLRTTAGIAVLVDFGATEVAVETAIATLPRAARQRMRVCDAPIVEGAMIVGIEAARGASLEEVCARAEAFSRPRSSLAC